MKFSSIYIKPIFLVLTLIVTAVFAVPATEAQVESRGGEHKVVYPSWDGVWSTSYGRMELAQDGTEVVGYYSSDEGNGRIYGDAKNYVFIGTWTLDIEDSPTQGPIEFTISEDGLSFTGWWAFDTDLKTRNEWTGSKIGERELEEELSDVDYCLWRGAWEFDDGIFIFEQDIGSTDVTGRFLFNGLPYEFSGTADGWGLDFKAGDGSGHLDMDSSLGSFTGWFDERNSGEQTGLSGVFTSGETMVDFSGTWQTDLGIMEFTQQPDTGVVTSSMENTTIGEWNGRFELDGIVMGPLLSCTWNIETDSGTINGWGQFRLSDDGKSLNGRLSSTSEPGLLFKVKGFRK